MTRPNLASAPEQRRPTLPIAALCLVAASLSALLLFCGCSTNATEDPAPQDTAAQQAPSDTPEPSEQQAGTQEAAPAPEDASTKLDNQVKEQLSSMTLEEKAYQLFVVRPEAITGVDTATQASDATKQAISDRPVGGIIYFQKNLLNPDQTKALLGNTQGYSQDITGLPMFLCVDEEGGTVARIGNNSGFDVPDIGNMCDVGATGDPSQAQAVGTTIGGYLAELGFNVDFAPDADIADNPDSNVMALRSFGSDATLVSSMVGAAVQGFNGTGVLCCAKHFPGIGAAEGDSHETSISTDKTVDQMAAEELLPFQAAIASDVPFVMVGHLSTPAVTGDDTPASLSSAIITDVLRNRLGFDGIAITDALEMGAIDSAYGSGEASVMALEAGADMLLMPADLDAAHQAILDAVQSGRLTEDRIDQSVGRILHVKLGKLA